MVTPPIDRETDDTLDVEPSINLNAFVTHCLNALKGKYVRTVKDKESWNPFKRKERLLENIDGHSDLENARCAIEWAVTNGRCNSAADMIKILKGNLHEDRWEYYLGDKENQNRAFKAMARVWDRDRKKVTGEGVHEYGARVSVLSKKDYSELYRDIAENALLLSQHREEHPESSERMQRFLYKTAVRNKTPVRDETILDLVEGGTEIKKRIRRQRQARKQKSKAKAKKREATTVEEEGLPIEDASLVAFDPLSPAPPVSDGTSMPATADILELDPENLEGRDLLTRETPKSDTSETRQTKKPVRRRKKKVAVESEEVAPAAEGLEIPDDVALQPLDEGGRIRSRGDTTEDGDAELRTAAPVEPEASGAETTAPVESAPVVTPLPRPMLLADAVDSRDSNVGTVQEFDRPRLIDAGRKNALLAFAHLKQLNLEKAQFAYREISEQQYFRILAVFLLSQCMTIFGQTARNDYVQRLIRKMERKMSDEKEIIDPKLIVPFIISDIRFPEETAFQRERISQFLINFGYEKIREMNRKYLIHDR